MFLGFLADAPPWQFYHPGSRRVLPSRDVTFDESVCFYRLHPHRSFPVPLPPLFLVPDPPPVSSDTYGPAEGGDPDVDDTAATCHSLRLETPSGPGGGAGGAGAGGAGVGGTGIGGAGGTSAGGTDTGGATSRGTRVGGTGGETVATCSTWHMRNVPAGTIFYLHLL
ncbi:unnamed protein product, partial [Closterium sp. NIES-54]